MMDTEDKRMLLLAMRAPVLTLERERLLVEAWQDRQDEKARDELIVAHLRMAIKPAMRHVKRGMKFADLMQEASLGIMRAADKFERERGFRLSTYCVSWIKSYIQDYVLRNATLVKFATTVERKKVFFSGARVRAEVEGSMGGHVPADYVDREVARRLGVDVQSVLQMRISGSEMSLNTPVGEDGDGDERIALLVDEEADTSAAVAMSMDSERLRGWITAAMGRLNEREASVILSRILCEDEEVQTLEVVADRFGISRERVRQIESKALEKLRTALKAIPGIGNDPLRLLTAA